jgi:hypothetical protein
MIPRFPPDRDDGQRWPDDERIDKRTDVGWNPPTQRDIPDTEEEDDD